MGLIPELWVPTRGHPFYGTVERLQEFGFARYMAGGLSVADTRNRIVREFLGGSSDILVMVDDDVLPPLNMTDIFTPIEAGDFQVVGAVVLTAVPGLPFMPNVYRRTTPDTYERVYGDGLTVVDAVGAGCVAIHRSAFDRLKAPFQFQHDRDGVVTIGEDINFCRRTIGQGRRVAADFNVICEHYDDVYASGVHAAYMGLLGQLAAPNKEAGGDDVEALEVVGEAGSEPGGDPVHRADDPDPGTGVDPGGAEAGR